MNKANKEEHDFLNETIKDIEETSKYIKSKKYSPKFNSYMPKIISMVTKLMTSKKLRRRLAIIAIYILLSGATFNVYLLYQLITWIL